MLKKVTPWLAPLLFGACSIAPGFERPQAPISNRWPTGEAGETGEIDWKGFFNDARLRKLVELSLANNRDARVAALNVEQI
ncbi:MAG TPA: multidrug transporter, partial [Luteolibacter sp.]